MATPIAPIQGTQREKAATEERLIIENRELDRVADNLEEEIAALNLLIQEETEEANRVLAIDNSKIIERTRRNKERLARKAATARRIQKVQDKGIEYDEQTEVLIGKIELACAKKRVTTSVYENLALCAKYVTKSEQIKKKEKEREEDTSRLDWSIQEVSDVD